MYLIRESVGAYALTLPIRRRIYLGAALPLLLREGQVSDVNERGKSIYILYSMLQEVGVFVAGWPEMRAQTRVRLGKGSQGKARRGDKQNER